MKLYTNKHAGITVITEADHDWRMYPGSRVLIAGCVLKHLRNILKYSRYGILARHWKCVPPLLLQLRSAMNITPQYDKKTITTDGIFLSRAGRGTRLHTLFFCDQNLDMVMLSPARIAVERSLLPKINLMLRHSNFATACAALVKAPPAILYAKRALGVPVQQQRKRIRHNQTLPPDAFAHLLAQLAEIEGCDPSQWQS